MTDKPNPYAAPRAAVDDVGEEKRGRTALVWVITIFMGIGVVGGAVSTIAALLGSPIGGAEAAEYTKHLTAVDHIFALVGSAIGAFATVALFRLKRYALPLFVAMFLLGIAVFAFNILLRPEYQALFEMTGYWGLWVGWAVNIAVIAYIWRLRVKGVLQ